MSDRLKHQFKMQPVGSKWTDEHGTVYTVRGKGSRPSRGVILIECAYDAGEGKTYNCGWHSNAFTDGRLKPVLSVEVES